MGAGGPGQALPPPELAPGTLPAILVGSRPELIELRSWEKAAARLLRAVGLESIHRKILVFGIVATLAPSFGIAWSSYIQNKRVVRDKIAQELATLAGPGARDIEIWLKQHLLDLRVFAGSEILAGGARGGTERKRTDYLESVRAHFADYEALAMVDGQGHPTALSTRNTKSVPLPSDWQSQLRTGGAVIGEP